MASVPLGKPTGKVPSDKADLPARADMLEERFRRLADEWERATFYLSSMEAASKHPAYQEIIALGAQLVPFLLRDLEANHTHWFIALSDITGAQPIPEDASGNIPKMAQAWVKWGKDNGYSW